MTGERRELGTITTELIHRVRPVTRNKLPLAVGFGLSTPDHVASVIRAGADGAIVGSALVRRVADRASPEEVAAYVHSLKAATRQGP